MAFTLKNILNPIKLILFPERCPFCKVPLEQHDYACNNCKSSFPSKGLIQGVYRGTRCVSTFLYDGKYRKAFLNFKFKHKKQYSKQLATIMYMEVCRSYPDMIFDCVTYVPMHKKEESKRGFNQSELLAKELSALLKVPCVNTLLKIKSTDPQHTLEPKERYDNLKGAFECADKALVKGKHILLVDDVITTGTTLNECTKTLYKHRPQLVCCLTLLNARKL